MYLLTHYRLYDALFYYEGNSKIQRKNAAISMNSPWYIYYRCVAIAIVTGRHEMYYIHPRPLHMVIKVKSSFTSNGVIPYKYDIKNCDVDNGYTMYTINVIDPTYTFDIHCINDTFTFDTNIESLLRFILNTGHWYLEGYCLIQLNSIYTHMRKLNDINLDTL